MSDRLSRYLTQLHSLLTADTLQRGVDANNTVVDLGSFCLENVSEEEQAYSSSLLFHEETGVISFLRKAVTHEEFLGAKVELLKFLKSYVMKLEKRVNPYVVDIKEICVKLFSQDRSNKVKVDTFPLLAQILEIKLESSVVEKLNIPRMIDKYFGACMQPAKHSSTVKCWLYTLLGILAEVFPEHMISQSDRLVSIYVNVLKSEMTSKTKKPDMPVIAGCLRGLTSYLTNFTQSVEEGSRYAKDIYSYARKAADPQVSLSRYEVPKAGLYLFAKHAAQFKEYIAKDYEDIYEAFYRWCKHNNKETSYAGYLAMEAFLKQMSDHFVSKSGDKSEMPMFKYFVKKFRAIIDSASSDTRQMSIAIRGYGYFSKPCKLFMQAEDVKFMFSEMMQRSEQIYLRQDELVEDKVQHLPSFLEALSCIVEELNEISDSVLASLERLVVVLFNNFTRLDKGSKFLCCKALVRVLFNLSSKGAVLRRFLSEVGCVLPKYCVTMFENWMYVFGREIIVMSTRFPVVSGFFKLLEVCMKICKMISFFKHIEAEKPEDISEDSDMDIVDTSDRMTCFVLFRKFMKEVLIRMQQYKDDLLASCLRLVLSLPLEIVVHDVGSVVPAIKVLIRMQQYKDDLLASCLRLVLSLPLEIVVHDVGSVVPAIKLTFKLGLSYTPLAQAGLDALQYWSAALPADVLKPYMTEILPCLDGYLKSSAESSKSSETFIPLPWFPVVSGFFKLLEVCMKICKMISFFKHIEAEKPEDISEDSDMDIVDTSDRMTCFVLFRKFMKEVLIRMQQYKDDLLASCLRLVLSLPLEIVVHDVGSVVPAIKVLIRMQQYKDDLLASCLRLVLSLPLEIVVHDVGSVVPAIKLTFKLGLSYTPLAQAGLDALQYWSAALPADVLKPYMTEILPCLDGYLKSSAESNEEDQLSQDSKTVVLSASRPGSRGRKIPLKLLKIKKQSQAQNTLTPLARLRHQILRLLGSLGGHTNMLLLGNGEIDPSRAVAWDSQNHLAFAVPFQDMKPNIYLDPLLPRVVELATSSSDRQTKVAACECLHSLVLYMLGKSVTQPHGSNKSPMEKLWKHVFPSLLQLACDVEQVSEQLFKPLVFQLIHWFTNNRKYESPETMALLDAILDGIIHHSDTALRDFSSQCVREFLQWSIKQTDEKQLEKSPINIKSLLKRLYSLALHPSAAKRLGAALAFNNIYTIFREESSLVDIFVLEILVNYLESLSLAHNDDHARGTQDQCVQVIVHLEKIIKVKAQLLNKENKRRRIPRGFVTSSSITLIHLIPWLVKQCGKPSTECRHQCMRLLCELAPLQPGVSSAADWMRKTYEDHQSLFVNRFEGGGGGQNGIQQYPTLSHVGGQFSLKEAFVWFDFLLAALDCYTWVFGQHLLSPSQVFTTPKNGKKFSVLFESLKFFVTKMAMFGINEARNCFTAGVASSKEEVFTPKEIDSYCRAKCTVIVRIMNFVTVLLQVSSPETLKIVPADFWSEDLFNVVLSCVMEPGVIGFNMGDVEVIEKLPEQTGALCKMLAQNLPGQLKEMFKESLTKKIALGSHCNLFDQLPLPLCGPEESQVDHLRLGHLVQGYQQLHSAGLLLPSQAESTPEQFSAKLLSAVYEGVKSPANAGSVMINLTPASQQLACKLLELAYDLGLKHNTLMEYIMQESTDNSGSSFGLAFYRTFQTSINSFFIREADERVSRIIAKAPSHPFLISSMLNGILDQVIREGMLRKRHGSSIVAVILNCWSSFDVWWSEHAMDLKPSMLMILKKVLMLDPKMVTDTSRSVFPCLIDMYLSFMNDKMATLAFKSQVLELLPYFTKLPEEHLAKLKPGLDTFVTVNFPLKSTEFIKGSLQYNDYIQALDKLLAAFVTSSSLMLLELLITVICRESQHVHEDQIQKSLVAFIQRFGPAPVQAKAAMDVCFAIFSNERDYRPACRRSVVERVCITFLLNTSSAALREFYIDHIKDIMGIIEGKQAKPSDANFESQLTSKLCCFELVEMLYTCLSKSDLNTQESSINKAYVGGNAKTGKEMTMAITKAARAAIVEDMRGETVGLELRRQYHCYAYNCLVALISCTQTELKFYVAFLFSENPVKGQLLLDNLVDCTKTYAFEVELSEPIERRKQMTAIRKEARFHSLEENTQSGTAGSTGLSVHYMCSQYLADSSLSEDISQYDFSTPIQAYSATEVTAVPYRASGGSTSTESMEESYEVSEDTVEMDELNSHECMAKITAVLKHLQQSKISPELQKGVTAVEMPTWMSPLHKKLTSSSTHTNIRLFIAKLIINQSKIFELYAKFWLTPLMELILQIKEADQPGTEGINYFIVDLVITMLSWNSTAIPEDRYLTSKLLEFLMSRTQHRNRAVFRNNLEIIKSMVEIWKSSLQVPTKVIFDAFANADPMKKDNAAGIQLLGIIAANGLSPISSDSTIDKDRFYSCLVSNLTFKYKEVHAAAAEVIGLLMKQVADVHKVFDGPLHDMVSQKLLSLLNAAKPEPDKFITCVHRLQLNYPPIVDRFVNQILFKLPSVYGDFKTYCLEILYSRVEHIPNMFKELRTKGLEDMLAQRDEESQVVILRIIQRLLKKLTVQQLQFIFPSVTAFVSHPSALCRDLMYDILIWIYDTFRADELFRAEEGATEILAVAKDHLLQGLADDNRDVKLKLRNFWSDESRLPGTTLERLVEVLRAMYSPNTESQYLSYTTNLILHLTSLSPDYGRMMFEQPLSECKFEEYQINYSWQQRHLLMTPLFAATQGSFSSGMMETQGSMSVDVPPGLRATQNLQFTPTQDQGRSQAFDWLNPSQEPNPSPSQSFVTTSTQAQSSLLFTTSQTRDKRKMLKPIPHDFRSQIMLPSQEPQSQVTSGKDEILRLKRRFLKEKSDRSNIFAKQMAKRNTLREQALERQKAARESRVVMYRKYRTGDLPDIQIKFCELIAPLQAVAQCDSTLAKQLFSALFQGVFSQIEEKLSEREAVSVISDIKSALNNMVAISTQFFPPFISSIQDICYHEYKLSVEPTSVSTACLTSLQQPIGIMLLEKQLLQIEDDGQSSHKRARSSTAPPTQVTTTWIELSKLYRSLGDYDVLRGIFTGHIGNKPTTQKALEAEARGDYSQALKLYNEAISNDTWTDGEPQQEEEDLWDDARLQCFANLSQWENLEKFSVLNIDDEDTPDLDKVWTDTFFQEHYLPYLITSKLKLQCQGTEDTSLDSFVTRAMQYNERRALLQGRHSDSLALMYLLQDDYDRASYYAGSYEQSFLVDWAGLDSMMSASRFAKLQSLQKMAEIQEFLEFITEEENFSSVKPVVMLLDKWRSRLPDPRLHPINVWDDLVTNRIVYMNKILRKFEAVGAEERSGLRLGEVKDRFLQHEVELQLHMANTAKEQANYPVANKHLREALKLIPQRDDSLQISWSHAYAEVHHRKTQNLTAVEAVETSLMVAGQLDKFSGSKILETEPLRGLRHHILRIRTLDVITKAISTDEGLVLSALDDNKKGNLARLCGLTSADSHKKVVSQLMTCSFVSLQFAIKAAKNAEESRESGNVQVQAMMAMVNFCDNCLRKKEEDAGPVEVDTKLFPGIVVRYMLKAMCNDSDEARQRFPRLLQIVEMYPDTLEVFIRKAADVPCWMFISWINQMLAVLDKSEGRAVHAILHEIAQTYPQALWYPFKISSEQFVFEDNEEGKASEEMVKSLQSSLDSTLLNDFIAALEQLTNPEMVFKDWCEGSIKQLLEDKNKMVNSQAIKDCFQNMFQNLLDSRPKAESGSQTRGNEFGPFRKKFAQEFSSEIQKLFGKEGEKLKALKPNQFAKLWGSVIQKMNDKRSRAPVPSTLKEYSPWLFHFQSSYYTHTLEIPGQYTGRKKPLPEYHVKIAGFDERVRVMASIRKPKRLIIRGDDQKDHMFLVKGGEDLRLDQRIEQLFGVMNDVMSNDPACSQRGLRLKTYQVIPMTPRVGLIEWIQNTKPLKEVLRDAMTKPELDHYSGKDGPNECHLKWIRKFKGEMPWNRFFGEMYKKASRTETERNFKQKLGLVPWDLLKRAFMQLSASPEAFLTLRSHFASTHACLSICQYILGIGDRHLSNFMVDMETGGMIGIDFGHAFGSATQFLPVPELMPFRLTSQFVNLMLPLKESGTLQSVMVHTLRALRNNHELLLNTMDVFIKEPSLDWQVFARKQAKAQGINTDDEDVAWYPIQKVKSARKKLEGFNPAYVMRVDLESGHKTNSWYKQMEAVCLGDKTVNIRAREPESGLSVECQVACLVDHAMDPNVLGRAYMGWEPWMYINMAATAFVI